VSFEADSGAHAEASTSLDAGHASLPDASHGSDSHVADAPASTTPDAGAVMRNAECTSTSDQTGTAVSTSHGRLDGTLVYVVGVGQGKQCNGDDSHVHLQIEVSGSVYDVAVDIGTAPNDLAGIYEESMAVPGGAWAEGWHGSDTLAYPSLNIHSSSFTTMQPDALGSDVETLLASTSKISIFCTGYSQGNGCHDVHYENGDGKDGAIVLNPTLATSQVLFFRFASQSF
jgi:hypothetical protein